MGFEFRGVDEVKQRKAEAVAKAFYGDDAGITAFSINDIFYRWFWHARRSRKLTQRNLLLAAQKEQSVPHVFICFHLDFPFFLHFSEILLQKRSIYDTISLYIDFRIGDEQKKWDACFADIEMSMKFLPAQWNGHECKS